MISPLHRSLNEPSDQQDVERILLKVRYKAEEGGRKDLFRGVPDDVNPWELRSMIVEVINPMKPTQKQFETVVVAGELRELADLPDAVRDVAFNEESPHREAAFRALALIDRNAEKHADRLQAKRVGSIQASIDQRVRSCCAGH